VDNRQCPDHTNHCRRSGIQISFDTIAMKLCLHFEQLLKIAKIVDEHLEAIISSRKSKQ